MAILKVEGVTKLYKDLKALDNVSFEFEKGILVVSRAVGLRQDDFVALDRWAGNSRCGIDFHRR